MTEKLFTRTLNKNQNKNKNYFSAVLDRIHFILAGIDDIHEKFGQIRLLVPMATDRVLMEKTVLPLFAAVFYLILFILAGNDDMHESSEEFEIRPDPTTGCGVSCP